MSRAFKLTLLCAFIASGLILLILGLSREDIEQSDVAIGRAFPIMQTQSLFDTNELITELDFSNHDFLLVNVWASWCGICKQEHKYLLKLANNEIGIVGLNYRDNRNAALNVLKQTGNPYTQVLFDPKGKLALDLGVLGTPETYLVNNVGEIVYRYSGALNQTVWDKKLAPKLKGLSIQ